MINEEIVSAPRYTVRKCRFCHGRGLTDGGSSAAHEARYTWVECEGCGETGRVAESDARGTELPSDLGEYLRDAIASLNRDVRRSRVSNLTVHDHLDALELARLAVAEQRRELTVARAELAAVEQRILALLGRVSREAEAATHHPLLTLVRS
jgi:hypothetical protein